jgi:hypothetical protein
VRVVDCIGGEADMEDPVALNFLFHITFELPCTITTQQSAQLESGPTLAAHSLPAHQLEAQPSEVETFALFQSKLYCSH